MDGEGPTYAAQRTIQPSQEDQTRNTCFTREGPVLQSASVLLNRVK
jgi:hypothetical protein